MLRPQILNFSNTGTLQVRGLGTRALNLHHWPTAKYSRRPHRRPALYFV